MDSLKLIDDYVKWYREKLLVKDFDGYSEIVTPYVNHLNDRVRLYLEEKPNDLLRISDDGETFNELALAGLDITKETRQRIITSVLRQFGSKLDEDIVYIECEAKNFPKAKHKMIETIIRLYDLLNTHRSNVTSLFTEEVQDYFYEKDFGGMPNVRLTGYSGIDYQVDYVLGARKNRPEIWVQIVNRFDYNSLARVNYIYQDIANNRDIQQVSKKILIYNDLENKVASKAIQASKVSDIQLLAWSQKEEFSDLLAQ